MTRSRVPGRAVGCVLEACGENVVVALPCARLGDGVVLCAADGTRVHGEITAVARGGATVAPFAPVTGIGLGDRAWVDGDATACVLGFGALGRAMAADGSPLDGGAALAGRRVRVRERRALAPGRRRPVTLALPTGVRALDALLTIGRGARVGLFGAPGAGKSMLLEAIVDGVEADAVVVALVGERGREAERWLARGNARTTIVCATADRGPAERVRAAEVALAQAETLRAHGLDVVLVVDSLARYAAALRERFVAVGGPVGRGGYPPAVWAALARFLERAGPGPHGSVTLVATVLSDGGDEREPLSDAARSLLDGHIALSATLAASGRFPAIDVLASASRTMHAVVDAAHLADAGVVRAALAALADSADARRLGLAGSADAALARAVAAEPELDAFLRPRGRVSHTTTRTALAEMARMLREAPP